MFHCHIDFYVDGSQGHLGGGGEGGRGLLLGSMKSCHINVGKIQ